MEHAAHLWLFFLVVFAVIILPGMDMAYVMGSALVGGRRHGVLAIAGIVVGGIFHVIAAALGIGLLLQVVPGLFNAVLIAGALYMGWIGWTLLRSRSGAELALSGSSLSAAATLRRGALTSLLNPKAYLFMLAIFPQFLDPQNGPIWLQSLLLWLVIALTQIGVYGALAFGAAGTRGWLAARPAAGLLLNRGVGAVLLLAAVWTGIAGWQA